MKYTDLLCKVNNKWCESVAHLQLSWLPKSRDCTAERQDKTEKKGKKIKPSEIVEMQEMDQLVAAAYDGDTP